jgi:NAD(P)-dependent dehydrogenase (short-subunit alcohol dehydrogenase family)
MVNSAGVGLEIHDPQPIWTTTSSIWDRTMAVNLTGLFNCCRAATAQMVSQEPLPNGSRGWIVNVSSVYGESAKPGIGKHCPNRNSTLSLDNAESIQFRIALRNMQFWA